MIEFARRNRLPFTWRDPERAEDRAAGAFLDGLNEASLPLVRLPGGAEFVGPSPGEVSRALGIGRELAGREEVDLLVVGAGPAGLGAAVYGASEGLDTLVIESTGLGGQAGASRRIENYLGFPAGITGNELTSRAVTQARKFDARLATPYRALRSNPGTGAMSCAWMKITKSQRVPCLSPPARSTGASPSSTSTGTRASASFTRQAPRRRSSAVRSGSPSSAENSAGQAAVWLARGGALVTLLHRRADLHETMSDYLVRELERYAVAVRDRSEIAELHGTDGQLEAVTLKSGERLRFSFLFLFLGASPCTEWLDAAVARDDHGFILTGAGAGVGHLLGTTVPGVLAAGDVRSGSTKRCATAVGEGAWAVQLVHAHLAAP